MGMGTINIYFSIVLDVVSLKEHFYYWGGGVRLLHATFFKLSTGLEFVNTPCNNDRLNTHLTKSFHEINIY